MAEWAIVLVPFIRSCLDTNMFNSILIRVKITIFITVFLTLRTLLHNVLTEATCEYSFCGFFAVNTSKDTSGFFNMLLLIYGVRLPPLCQKPLFFINLFCYQILINVYEIPCSSFASKLIRSSSITKGLFIIL